MSLAVSTKFIPPMRDQSCPNACDGKHPCISSRSQARDPDWSPIEIRTILPLARSTLPDWLSGRFCAAASRPAALCAMGISLLPPDVARPAL